jgi:hypothetical protein
MHPRSKRWHMIDFSVIRQTDLKSVKHTRVMRGVSATDLSDHRLIRTELTFSIKFPVHHKSVAKLRGLNVSKLRVPTEGVLFREKITENLELVRSSE